jgi:eukaryotic-like serine/threonine-protein kinase
MSAPILPSEEWESLEEIFVHASELDPFERTTYLDSLQGLLPGVRRRLVSLLATLDEETKISNCVDRVAAHALQATAPSAGGSIGPYRLLSVIGRGGMGVVYRAVRGDASYHKEVAIKVALSGMTSVDLRQRFLYERQILANLEHANIARLMDGGTTEDGTPYVVMELVTGQPIDTWLEERQASRRERLLLLITVCRTVDYAHRHLVVHRDLKPANIYVTAEGAPKLLDFGIAKALAPQASGMNTSKTIDAMRLMTPAYASPEQILGKPVTTGTDVYQLGILLYQLLCGRRPFELTTERMGEMERLICEVAPPKPNLDDDLDRILLQTLEKEPSRRYATAGELADDLERYLYGYPVTARAASWSYYARKFVLRHKLAVGTALAGLLLLVGFSIAVTMQAKRLAQERNTAQQVSDFLETVFSASETSQARGRTMTAKELLDRGANSIDHERGLDPLVKERLLQTLTEAYRSQGIYDRAQALNTELLELRRQLYGERSNQVADALAMRTMLDSVQERYDVLEIDAREWLDLVDSLHEGPNQRLEYILDVIATSEFVHSNLTAAETTARRSIKVSEELHGDGQPEMYYHLGLLGNILFFRGDFSGEEMAYRREYDFFQKRHAEDTPEVEGLMDAGSKLGNALGHEGRYAEAEQLLRHMLALRLKVNGLRSDRTAMTQSYLGMVLGELGQTAEAETVEKQALATEKERIGARMNYGAFEQLLAEIYEDEGRYELAEPLLKDRSDICIRNLGGKSLALARTLSALGRVQTAAGQLKEARKTLESAFAMEQQLNGDAFVYAAADHVALGNLEIAENNLPMAEASLRHAVELYRTTAQGGQPGKAEALESLGALLLHENHHPEAQALLAEAVDLRRASVPAGSRTLLRSEALLAHAQR